MEAKESKIIDILTENKKYTIPPYQRPYSWDRSNTEQLIADIFKSFCQEDEEYFIGTLICIYKGEYTYEIVDGQQRLTTLSLIFAKMKDLISANKRAKENLQKRVLPIDDFSDKPQEPRLKVRSKEFDLYCNYILQGNIGYLPEVPTYTQKLFIDNFKAIEEYLLSKVDDESTLCNLAKYILEHVYVVFVQTDDFTSSYRLFNVLNDRGMPLAASDLIKNTLFEIAEEFDSSYEKVEDYWDQIEDSIGVENIDKFLVLNKVSQKRDRDRAIKNLVDEYTDLLKNVYHNKTIDFTVDLLKSAANYQKIKDLEFDDISLFRIFSSLSKLTDEWIPPILAFMNRMEKDKSLTKKQFKEFVQTFEKCYIHGWFKKLERGKREVVCYSALVAINIGKEFQEIIDAIREYGDNQGFISALDEDIYEPIPNRINFSKLVLLRIDQELQDDSVCKTYYGRITIEHILPQRALNSYWKERFTYEEHSTWLHKLGNLTLVSGSKNAEAQNSSFDRKKEIYMKNNKRVSFDLTKDLCEYSDWNLFSLKERHQRLSDVAKQIWLL